MKLSSDTIKQLHAEHVGALKATVYIPTNPIPDEQNRTRLKNALQTIKNDPAYDDRELGASLSAIYDEIVDNDSFWRELDYGLALLFDHDGYEYFYLPFELSEAEYLTDHFVISPLAIMASADTGFYLLDINFTKPRLFVGARGVLQELNVDGMPKSFDSEMGRSSFKNHSLGGEDNALGEDEKKYLQNIVDAVNPYLAYDQRALLLAGTANRIGNIRPMLSHGHVLADAMVGNYETADIEQLYKDAQAIVKPALRAERDAIAQKVANTAPEYVVIGTSEIVEAAASGRVAEMVVPAYRVTTDNVLPTEDETVVLELPADIESIEGAVRAVVEKGGEIAAVEIGSHEALDEPKAICRY